MGKENDHNHILRKKFDEYVPAEDYFEKGLYISEIGRNDLTIAFYSQDLDQIIAQFQQFYWNLKLE